MRSLRAGVVGAVREKVGKSREPEQAVGSRIVTELELEIGERATRCGQGNAHAAGPPAALAPSSSVEGAHEADGTEPKIPAPMASTPIRHRPRHGAVDPAVLRSGRVVVVCVVVVCGGAEATRTVGSVWRWYPVARWVRTLAGIEVRMGSRVNDRVMVAAGVLG